MKSISKRELNQQTAQVLAQIKAGAPVLITERGVARWRIEAIDAQDDPVARLRAAGMIRPASKTPPPWPKDEGRLYTPEEIDALYAEMREDR